MRNALNYPWVWLLVLLCAVAPVQADDSAAAAEAKPAVAAAAPPAATAEAPPDAATAKAEAPADQGEAEPKPPEPDIALAFKDVPLEQICKFIEEKLEKPVVPHEAIKAKKITIISSRKHFLPEALQIIAEALRQNGVIIQEHPLYVEFLPITEARHTQRRVIGPDESVSDVENKAWIVDKVFDVRHYDVLKLQSVIVPMLPDYAFVVADPNVRKLIVTDTVSNLERIEAVVARLDVPMADQTIKKIIKIKNGDASQIVALLRPLIGAPVESPRGGRRGDRGGPPPPTATGSLSVAATETPVLLMAEVSRNWIIAVASAHVMAQIEAWVEELDQGQLVEEPFDFVEVKHAEIQEVASQITAALNSMPSEDIKGSTRIVPFAQSRQLLVFGSARGRDFVKALLKELDKEESEFQQYREFVLENADAETVADKIEALFSNITLSYRSTWGSQYRSSGPKVIQVTFDSRRNSVTVITDPIRMKRVAEMIETEWDQPLDTSDVQPRIYELTYADPIQVKDLLEDLFTTQRSSSGPYWDRTVEEVNPVGRLTGQFSFQAMDDSNVLIVTTKSESNYAVIDDLIEKLDKPQEAGLPQLIELKHANAEDLAEQLNAMLAETGAPAQIRRSQRKLSSNAPDDQADQANNNNRNPQPQQEAPGEMKFWWSSSRQRMDERPISNLIGTPRFVPVNRRNALMVLAPAAYMTQLTELIEELDRPGLQVVIHAIIAEIQHDDVSTLGLRVAADPSILSDPRLLDGAVGGSANLGINELFGGTFNLDGKEIGRGVLDGNVNISYLVQMLIKKVNLQILFEPRLFTADNQQAEFFDGQRVPVQTGDQRSSEGASTSRTFQYINVGTRLLIRPHITQEGAVDLTIDLEVSRTATGEAVSGNPVINQRQTTTHVIVGDGETIMISGIISREDFNEQRKAPVLGYLPLVGGLFRSTDKGQRNREMIVFITPRVIGQNAGEREQLEPADRQMLERLRKDLSGLDKDAEEEEADTP